MAADCALPLTTGPSTLLNQGCRPSPLSLEEDVKAHSNQASMLPQEPTQTEETGGESSMFGDQDSRKRKQVCTDEEERKARRRASNRNSAKRMRQQRSQVLNSLQQEVLQLRHMCQMLAADNQRCAQDCAEIESQNHDIRSEISHLETLLSTTYDMPRHETSPMLSRHHPTSDARGDPWTPSHAGGRRLLPGGSTDMTPAGIHSNPLATQLNHRTPRPKSALLQPLSHNPLSHTPLSHNPLSPTPLSRNTLSHHNAALSPAIPRPTNIPTSVGHVRASRTSLDYTPRTSSQPPFTPAHCELTVSEEEAYSPECAVPQNQYARPLKRPKICSVGGGYAPPTLMTHLPEPLVRSPDSYAPTPTHHMNSLVSHAFPRLTSRGGSSTGSDSYTASSYSSYTMAGGSPGPVASPISKPYDSRATYATHTALQYRGAKPGVDTTVNRPPDSILSMRANQAGSNSVTPVKRPASMMDSAALPSPIAVSSVGGGEAGHGGVGALGVSGHPSWMQPASSAASAQDSPIESMLDQHVWYNRD